MLTKLRVIEDNPYLGKRTYVIAKVTKTQLITEPINSVGAVMRFRRPDTLTDGAKIFEVGLGSKGFNPVEYTLRIERSNHEIQRSRAQ